MTPTRPGPLLGLVAVFAVLGYLLVSQAFGSLTLPGYVPVPIVLLVLVELAMARVVRSRLGRPRRGRIASDPSVRARPIHPLQVARAAVLAKASSATGAILLGGYGGALAWALPRRGELAVADRLALVSGASVVACLALVAAALLLERACRTPDDERR